MLETCQIVLIFAGKELTLNLLFCDNHTYLKEQHFLNRREIKCLWKYLKAEGFLPEQATYTLIK